MFNRLVTDAYSNEYKAFVMIDMVHHYLHEGRMFQSSYKTPDASPIADNANISFYCTVGANEPHLVASFACGGEAEVEIYESTVVSVVGTVLRRFSMNRNANLFIPTTAFYHTPTVTTAGVLMHNSMLPGGSSNQTRSGATIRESTEWELKTNTNYLFRLTNRAGNAQQASMVVQWYER